MFVTVESQLTQPTFQEGLSNDNKIQLYDLKAVVMLCCVNQIEIINNFQEVPTPEGR